MSITDKISQAYNFFRDKGYSAAQAAGIVGNLTVESGLSTTIRGDGGKAVGLAQWHPDRQSIFKRIFGKPLSSATFQEQLAFVDWELNNSESNAGNLLKKATSAYDATKIFMEKYERPASGASFNDRLNAAGNALEGGGILGTMGSWVDALREGMTVDPELKEALANQPGIAGSLLDWFSGGFVARITYVVVGVILIGLAIAAFVFLGDNGKNIVSKVVS